MEYFEVRDRHRRKHTDLADTSLLAGESHRDDLDRWTDSRRQLEDDMMSRSAPLFFVQVQGDLINTVSVHTDSSGTAVVTLGYGATLTLRVTGAVPALRYLVRDLTRQLDQIADSDMQHPPMVAGASLVTDRRSNR